MKNVINLGKFSRRINVIKNGVTSSQKNMKLHWTSQFVKLLQLNVLNGLICDYLLKIMHVAADTIKSLQVFFKTHWLQDLSMCLIKNEFENNLKVDAIAPHGNIDKKLSAAEIGYLTDVKISITYQWSN